MRSFIFLLFLLPAVAMSQDSKQFIFVNLVNTNGTPIKGEAGGIMKGYEKTIGAYTISSGGKNNTQLTFSMDISGSAAELKSAMNSGSLLPSGDVGVFNPKSSSTPRPSYVIKMEKIRVLSCTETVGCDNAMRTSVTLQATRIGWTYYDTRGAVSNKYGFDAESGGQWTSF